VLVLIIFSPFLLVYTILFCPCIASGSLAEPSVAEKHSEAAPQATPDDEVPGTAFEWTQNKRGIWLFSRWWVPSEPNNIKALVFICHGYAETINRKGGYGKLAAMLVQQGFAVFGQDYEGHGRSTGKKAYFPSMRAVVSDNIDFIVRKCGSFPNKPVYIFGFSMGGLIGTSTILRMIQQKIPLSGAILKAPALFVDPKLATPVKKLMARVFANVAPTLPVGKGGADLISRNKELVERIKTDPKLYHGGMHARVANEFLSVQGEVVVQLAQINVPLLCLYGAADRLVDPKGAQTVYKDSSSSDKTIISYPDSLHDLFEEGTPNEEKFLNDIVQWYLAHTKAEP